MGTFGAAQVPFFTLRPDAVEVAVRACREDAETEADFLECISGYEEKSKMVLTYFLVSQRTQQRVIFRTRLEADSGGLYAIPSIQPIFPSAWQFESELQALLGIDFTHPTEKNVSFRPVPEQITGYPLRREFRLPEIPRPRRSEEI